LQLNYRDKRRNDGHLYYDATGDTDLELKVERLRDELAKLRQAFNLWQNKILRDFAVVFVLLVLIAGSAGGSATGNIGTSSRSAQRLATLPARKFAPSCSSPLSASTRPPSPRQQRQRAGRNASASAKRTNRPMPPASPASMN
jgi:hypothetical protein